MKAKKEKTIKPTIASRKPWGRLDEETKNKIISEVNNGLLSERAAGRKYGLPKSTIGMWRDKHNLANLLSPQFPDGHLAMDESKELKLLKKKIDELTKALSDAQLKNVALETMIEVAESELKIKIRKKRGTKQS
ncbi:hypothetical protein WG904_15120 [Pedobacter sp. Du54]|uniref:hypothetical protein n=1 Tax=Pedobacter anseongensis TaxID=3133439 RepID=UPI00309ECA8D